MPHTLPQLSSILILLNTFFLVIIERDLVFDIMKYFVECYQDQTRWSAHDRSLSLILSS